MTITTEWAVHEATRAIQAERARQTASRLEVAYQEACAWSARVDAMQEEARRVADALSMDHTAAWERADDLANLLVREGDAAWEARYDAQMDWRRARCWTEGVA